MVALRITGACRLTHGTVAPSVGRKHEIDHRSAAGFSLEFGFKDEGPRAISPSRSKR